MLLVFELELTRWEGAAPGSFFFAFFIVFVINLQISFAPDHTGHFERGKFIDHVRKLDLGTLLDHVHVEARVFADRRHFVH